MKTVEALDYAIGVINRRRVTADTIGERIAALETLAALRDTLVDQAVTAERRALIAIADSPSEDADVLSDMAFQALQATRPLSDRTDEHVTYMASVHLADDPQRHEISIGGNRASCSCGWTAEAR